MILFDSGMIPLHSGLVLRKARNGVFFLQVWSFTARVGKSARAKPDCEATGFMAELQGWPNQSASDVSEIGVMCGGTVY